MTARERRIVRWGASATAVIFTWVLVLDPWLVRRSERSDAIAAAEARLGRLHALERSLPELREGLGQARAVWSDDIEPRLLPGGAPAVAASRLAEEVRALAAASLLEVEREDPLPAREEDGLRVVPVQFSLRGDVYGLRDFLGALETADTFLHLAELTVSAAGATFGPLGTEAPLQLTVTLEGILGEEAPADAIPAPLNDAVAEPATDATATPSTTEFAPPAQDPSGGVMPPGGSPADAVSPDAALSPPDPALPGAVDRTPAPPIEPPSTAVFQPPPGAEPE